jgi:universal stress protein A
MVPAVLSLKTILVPIDFSKNALQALHFAVPLARQFGAKLALLHVVPIPPYGADMAFPAIDLEPPTEHMEAELRKLVRRTLPAELDQVTMVRTGPPHHEIVEAAKELSADLIVLTTHGYTGLKHALLGSTAERVVQHAGCPVLVVR